MKKKIVLIVFLVFLLSLFFLFSKKEEKEKVVNLKTIKEEELFLKKLSTDEVVDKEILLTFSVVDENNRPIKNAEIEITGENQVIKLVTNADGYAGINGLEKGSYQYQQKKTRKNLKIDSTSYTITLYRGNTYFYQIVNVKEELSDNDRKELTKKYEKKNTYLQEEDEVEEEELESDAKKDYKNAYNVKREKYYFINKAFLREFFEVSIFEDTKWYPHDDIYLRKHIFKFSNAYLKKYTITLKKEIEGMKILDTKKKERKTFQNGEAFYISFDEKKLKTYEEVPAKIEFTIQKDGVIYQLEKTLLLGGTY